MRKFRIGDKVICINNSSNLFQRLPKFRVIADLEMNKIYTVIGYGSEGIRVSPPVKSHDECGLYEERFEFANKLLRTLYE